MENAFKEYLNPPKKERLPDTIATQIKTLILSKKIAYGEKLPSGRDLADMLQVSRVVVKQALMLLEQGGFIEIRRGPKGGAFTTNRFYKPFSESIKDLFQEGDMKLNHFCDARTAVECCSIKLAATHATDDEFERLGHIHELFLEETQKVERFAKHNRAFHITIAEISGNPLIKSIILSLLEYFSGFWNERYPAVKHTDQFRQFIKDVIDRHQGMVDALKIRDVDQCLSFMSMDTSLHTVIKDLESLDEATGNG